MLLPGDDDDDDDDDDAMIVLGRDIWIERGGE
jgi:hypothetical protein